MKPISCSENIFLAWILGTEEGKVHKCSKTYSSQFLDTFDVSDVYCFTLSNTLLTIEEHFVKEFVFVDLGRRIIWLFILWSGIIFTQRCLFRAVQTGLSKYGITPSRK